MDSRHGQAGTTKTAPWQQTPGAAKINECVSDGGRYRNLAEWAFKQEHFTLRCHIQAEGWQDCVPHFL